MPHPWRVSKDAAKSPLSGFSSSVHKIIETAIEKNDLDFFYRLYLTRMAELSLTGQGEEFIKYAKSSLDDSQNSLFMAKGFEAIGNLIDRIFRSPGVFRGAVVDFVQIPYWAIFNVADMAVSISATIIAIMTLMGKDPYKKKLND